MTNLTTPGRKGKLLLGLSLAVGTVGGLTMLRRWMANRFSSPLLEVSSQPRTALITGASSGIGAAFARQLAAKGYHLILVARRGERLAALAAELRKDYPIAAEVLVADLSSLSNIERVERRIAELENLELLINNAGFGAPGPFAEVDLVRHMGMIHVHIIASVRLSRAALPGMMARRRGAIINVSSLASFVPMPGSTTYSATKAYLNVFSEALQAELKGTGVKIQALCPGFTHTGFHYTPEHGVSGPSRIPELLWMPAQEVATQSLNALSRGQVIFVPGLKNRLLAVVARKTPPLLLQVVRKRSNN
jgi:short-subunit dehydrogenase